MKEIAGLCAEERKTASQMSVILCAREFLLSDDQERIIVILEAVAAELTDYAVFRFFLEDGLNGSRGDDGQADADVEYPLDRVYDEANWYVIQVGVYDGNLLRPG